MPCQRSPSCFSASPSSPVVRAEAAWALGWVEDGSSVASLIEALEAKDSGIVEAAATALGQIGDPTAVDPLIALGREDTRGAKVALARIGGAEAGNAINVLPDSQ
jgi:hypothetical protein